MIDSVFDPKDKMTQREIDLVKRLNDASEENLKATNNKKSSYYIPLSNALFSRSSTHLGSTDFVNAVEKGQKKLLRTETGKEAYVAILENVTSLPVGKYDKKSTNELRVISDVMSTSYIDPRPAAISAVMGIPGIFSILQNYLKLNFYSSSSPVHSAVNTLYGSLLGKRWSAYSFIQDTEPMIYEIVAEHLLSGEMDTNQAAILKSYSRTYEEIAADIENIDNHPVFKYPSEIVSNLMISWEICPETQTKVPYVINEG